MRSIDYINFNGVTESCNYDFDPDTCPYCHRIITPRRYSAYYGEFLEITYVCSNRKCMRVFVGIFEEVNIMNFEFDRTSIGNIEPKIFSEQINALSSEFVEIYNQANTSESLQLVHISGLGYRKSLEFLIKDYLINKNPEKTNLIKKEFLGKCIKEYVENDKLKMMAKRAAWLGNDEAHYVKKWQSKDIKDLKVLIDLSIHWIEMELLTEQYKSEMN